MNNKVFAFRTTLAHLAEETGYSVDTLRSRLDYKKFNMVEGMDYIRLGERQPILLSNAGVQKILQEPRLRLGKLHYLETKDLILNWTEEDIGGRDMYKVVGTMENTEEHIREEYTGYIDISLDRKHAFVYREGLNDAKKILEQRVFYDAPIEQFFRLVTNYEVYFLPWWFKEYTEHTYLVEQWKCSLKENWYRQYAATHKLEENKTLAELLLIEE